MVARSARHVVLQFDPALDALRSGKRLSQGMSAVVAIGETLWLTHDETVAIERLVVERPNARSLRYAEHRRFYLRDLITLPVPGKGPDDEDTPEADIEGISFCGEYLWAVGSHSAARGDAEGRTPAEAIAALATVRRSGNRFLLARIPVVLRDGAPTLARECRTDDGRLLRAARLSGGRKDDDLTRVLRADPHLGPFLRLPSKDNGFDIEGLAAAPGGRLFLGLRGPVLDGWACVLEIGVAGHAKRSRKLALTDIGRSSARSAGQPIYRKHFLDLGGAGIRDLCLVGNDLLILTGPPMRGKGTSEVRRWRGVLGQNRDTLLTGKQLPTLLELPYAEKRDHAEGIALLRREGRRVSLMVIYDSVRNDRRLRPAAMRASVHALSLSP